MNIVVISVRNLRRIILATLVLILRLTMLLPSERHYRVLFAFLEYIILFVLLIRHLALVI